MTFTVTDKRGTADVEDDDRPRQRVFRTSSPPPWFPVFVEFEAERLRQLEKWGDQRGLRGDGTVGAEFYVRAAAEYQRQNDAREAAGKRGVWDKILLEEIYEALSESDPDRLAHELIQAGAVITAWLEDLAPRRTREEGEVT